MSCLAVSEYEKWLSIVKPQYNDLLSDEYFKWLKDNRGELFEKLKQNYIIQPKVVSQPLDFLAVAATGTDDEEAAPF